MGLLGRSGSGKTSLIKSALCLNPGRSYLDGEDFCLKPRYDLVSGIFQEPSTQILELTLRRELELMSRFHRVDFSIAQNLMGEYMDQEFFRLSDGYRRRFVLSSVLAVRPTIVLLDEPFSNLDSYASDSLKPLIRKGSLVAEHRISQVRDLLDRVYLIREGGVREIEKDKLYDSSFLRREGLRGFTPELPPRQSGGVLLDSWVRGVRIRVRKGEVVCIVGRNGSGKTTIMKSLVGRVHTVFQNPDLQFFSRTVLQEVGDREVLKRFGLGGMEDRSPFTMSYGEKMRVLIAAAFSSGKEVLGFDEPTTGMDGNSLLEFLEALQDVLEQGKGVILTTHDDEIKGICDQVIDLDSTLHSEPL